MNYGQLLLETIEENNEKNLNKLTERLAKSNSVIPFVGAGMSVPIYGTWREYLQAIILPTDKSFEKALEEELNIGNYEKAAQTIKDDYGIMFYDNTEEYFSKKKIKIENISNTVKQLPKLFQGPVLTTNLDRVIEYVYKDVGIDITTILANSPDLVQIIQTKIRNNESCLWKIHGDVENRQSWVLTEEEYNRQYGAETGGSTLFKEYLSKILEDHVLLFLGCSLQSDKIVKVLKEICKENPYIEHYAILPISYGKYVTQDDNEKFNQRMKELGKMGVKPIWYRKGEYDRIVEYLQRLSKDTAIETISNTKNEYHFELPEDLFVKKNG